MALQSRGKLDGKDALASERRYNALKANGALSDPQQVREQAQSEAVDCIHCGQPVHPTLWKSHIDTHHPGGGYGEVVLIDSDLRQVLPALTAEERSALETSILAEGVREAVIVWSEYRLIVDGHHRWAICQSHGIPCPTRVMDFDSRDDVILWMLDNQEGRRNLNAFQRTELALKRKEVLARKAKFNQLAGLKQGEGIPVLANSPKRDSIDTREEIAAAAHVGSNTVGKVEAILREGSAEVIEQARQGEISIHKAFTLTKSPLDKAEALPEDKAVEADQGFAAPNYKRDQKANRAGVPYEPQGYDACQTPPYAIDPLLPYLERGLTIWEPAAGEQQLVEAFYDSDFETVRVSDLLTGQNFFEYQPEEHWDLIITNPPYSLKYEWLEQCHQLGKPFALLLPVEVLGAKRTQILMQKHGFEIMLLDSRVDFKMPNTGWNGAGAQFPVLWYCWNLLPEPVNFGSISEAKKAFRP